MPTQLKKWLLLVSLTYAGIDLSAQNKTDSTTVQPAKVLTETTVTARSPTLRSGPDKKVFSVNQSLVSLGGTAADLLQNIPTLQLDANGNVSLRGATDVQVLVDGKRTLIGGGTVAQVLQSIPASAIDRVEIITNPSAKYDAQGLALINIVLKKNKLPGYNGSIAITAGTRDNYNMAAAIAYQYGRVNLYGNYSYQRLNTYSDGYQDMTYLAPSNPAYYSNETFPSVTITDLQAAKAGIDYTLTAKDELSLSGVYNASTTNRSEWLTVDNLTATYLPVELSTRHNATAGDGNSHELTLDYTHKFSMPQKELTFDFDYSKGVTDNLQLYTTYVNNIDGSASDSTSLLKDIKQARTSNYNIQLDYTTPIGRTGRLETGCRSQISTAGNREWDYNLDEASGEYLPDDSVTNFFNSTSQVHAAYINFRQEIKSYVFQLGVRGELGMFNGNLQSFDSSGNWVMLPVTVNTKGLYPNALLIRRLSDVSQLQLSYSRRVTRPTPKELNPFWDVSDPVNYDEGNPRLVPENIHSAELTYDHTWFWTSLTAGAYFIQANNVIKHIQAVPVNDVTITIAENLPRAITTGLELIGHVHPVNPWDFTLNVNLYERFNEGDSAFGISATQGFSWNVNLTNNFSLAKNLTLQVRTDYKAADLIIQDRYRPTYGVDAAARYDFWHGKASLAANARDIFNTRRWTFFRVSDALLLNFQRVTYSARASLTFTYRFGKGNVGARTPKRPEAQQDTRIENR
jgi:ferric enterobactin receptor